MAPSTDRTRIPFFPLLSMIQQRKEDVFLDRHNTQLRKEAGTTLLAPPEKKRLFFAKNKSIKVASNYSLFKGCGYNDRQY
jgi:hypothetical protein